MSYEHHECTGPDDTVLKADRGHGEYVMLTITDNLKFLARIELPLDQLRELFNEGFSE